MKFFKKLHKDQLSDFISKFLKLENKFEVLGAVYSPLQPKNHTTDIWIKCKNMITNDFLYMKINLYDKNNNILCISVLPDIVEKYAIENNSRYKRIILV